MWSRSRTTVATCVLVASLGSGSLRAETASDILQKAVYVEETQGQLDEAMKLYERIVQDSNAARPAVAQAYYRLGTCYLKKQKPAEAKFIFENLIDRYSEQAELTAKAREHLAALSGGPSTAGASGTAPAGPPEIVSVSPAVGATDVDPALDKITVRFNQDMNTGGYSWTGGGPEYPETTGRPAWVDKRTCVLPVKLQPAKYYRLGINSTSYQNFRSASGVPVSPRDLYFTTRGADAQVTARMKAPAVVTFVPANGAADVDPALTNISVTFDQPMGGGMSWTGGGPNFPEMTGKPTWDATRQKCTALVKLQPGTEYRIGINSVSHRNFKSEAGVSVEPMVWTFRTRAQ